VKLFLKKGVNGERESDDPFRSNGRTGQDGFARDLAAALFVSIPKSGGKVKNRNGGGLGKCGVPGKEERPRKRGLFFRVLGLKTMGAPAAPSRPGPLQKTSCLTKGCWKRYDVNRYGKIHLYFWGL
jgi:hypothetical protein